MMFPKNCHWIGNMVPGNFYFSQNFWICNFIIIFIWRKVMGVRCEMKRSRILVFAFSSQEYLPWILWEGKVRMKIFIWYHIDYGFMLWALPTTQIKLHVKDGTEDLWEFDAVCNLRLCFILHRDIDPLWSTKLNHELKFIVRRQSVALSRSHINNYVIPSYFPCNLYFCSEWVI